MDDRFKFRAWDTKQKIMIYDIKPGWFCSSYAESKEKDRVLMQCTGLKDKKENFIWEYDLIIYKRLNVVFNKWEEKIGFVEFKNGCFGIEDDYNLEVICSLYQDVEIMGNKFENEELLK